VNPGSNDSEALYEPDRALPDEYVAALEATVLRYNLINDFLNKYSGATKEYLTQVHATLSPDHPTLPMLKTLHSTILATIPPTTTDLFTATQKLIPNLKQVSTVGYETQL